MTMKTEWKMENGEWDEKQTSIVFQVTGTSGLCEAGRVTLYLDQSRPGRIKGATNVVAAPKKRTAKKREKHAERNAKESSLTLHLLSLSDLGRETRLDGRDGPSGTARVACDKVQTVLALVELGVGRFACFADNVFDCLVSTELRQHINIKDSRMYFRRTFSMCCCWKRPRITNRRLPSTEPEVPSSASRYRVMWSSVRFMRLATSVMLAKMVFLLPSRMHCGGGIL
jgi:hypothetical protein